MADINALMENNEFVEKLTATSTTEEVIKVFADYGVTVTEAELEEGLAQAKSSKNGELSAADLENVSGGVVSECIALGYLLIKVGDKMGSWDWWRRRLGV